MTPLKNPRCLFFGLLIIFFIGIGVFVAYGKNNPKPVILKFDGNQAYADVQYQLLLGPRIPDSSAHDKIVTWMQAEMQKYGWTTEIQSATVMGHPVINVIGKRGDGSKWIVLGAHYDSRIWADQDPDPTQRQSPVPGADDGASGVGVLLELARSLPNDLDSQVWLVFFDAEDDGDIPGWNWLLGSQLFVDKLTSHPDEAVIVDMVGDSNLNIYKERNSNQGMVDSIWSQAASLGYSENFIDQYKYSMLDDHTPFLNAGIPAVDIIDFDYPYWHTTQDTLDKVSARSLEIVGDTLWHWLVSQSR